MIDKPQLWRPIAWGIIVCAAFLQPGCQRGKETVPVRGQVFLDGQPLPFGSVMLQPESGQPAIGPIQPDGSFLLSTFKAGDGAVVGRHKVRIACYESQRPATQRNLTPGSGEPMGLGKSLIPAKYAHYATSGLVIEIVPGRDEPLIFRLERAGNANES